MSYVYPRTALTRPFRYLRFKAIKQFGNVTWLWSEITLYGT